VDRRSWSWGKLHEMAALAARQHHPAPDRSKNLAGVAIPVSAHVPAGLRIHFVEEFDPHASRWRARYPTLPARG